MSRNTHITIAAKSWADMSTPHGSAPISSFPVSWSISGSDPVHRSNLFLTLFSHYSIITCVLFSSVQILCPQLMYPLPCCVVSLDFCYSRLLDMFPFPYIN